MWNCSIHLGNCCLFRIIRPQVWANDRPERQITEGCGCYPEDLGLYSEGCWEVLKNIQPSNLLVVRCVETDS